MTKHKLLEACGRYVMVVVAALLALAAGGGVFEGGAYLLGVLTEGQFLDIWTFAFLLEAILGCVAIAAAAAFLRRGKLGAVAAILLLPAPVHFLIEVGRCDYGCSAVRWATLPREMLGWRVRIRDAPRLRPIARRLTARLQAYPAGVVIPQTFLDQAGATDLGGVSSCFAPHGGEFCDAYVLDIDGDGAVEVVTASTIDQNNSYLASEVFKQAPGGAWRKSGELVVTCSASLRALRSGKLTLAPSQAHDLVLDGRRFSLLPDPIYGCPETGGKVPRLTPELAIVLRR